MKKHGLTLLGLGEKVLTQASLIRSHDLGLQAGLRGLALSAPRPCTMPRLVKLARGVPLVQKHVLPKRLALAELE